MHGPATHGSRPPCLRHLRAFRVAKCRLPESRSTPANPAARSDKRSKGGRDAPVSPCLRPGCKHPHLSSLQVDLHLTSHQSIVHQVACPLPARIAAAPSAGMRTWAGCGLWCHVAAAHHHAAGPGGVMRSVGDCMQRVLGPATGSHQPSVSCCASGPVQASLMNQSRYTAYSQA
jgi:hypothetical protein